MISFDVVLKEIGSFGRYQLLVILATSWCMVPIGSNLSAVVFLGYHGESRCAIPEFDRQIEVGNITAEEVTSAFIPCEKNKQGYSACQRYVCSNVSCHNDSSWFRNARSSASKTKNQTAQITGCTDGYYYDRSQFQETVTTEWNLVCEREGLNSLATALFCFGMLLGSLVGGSIADRYGRIPTMAFASLLNTAIGIACSFSPNFVVFAALRCVIGALAVTIQIAMVVYNVEIVGKKYRPWIGMQVGVFSGVGYMFLSLLGLAFRSWRTLQIALALSFAPFLFLAPFIPESPRWLFSQGKTEKAKKICRMMAQKNSRTLDESVWKNAESSSHDVGKRRISYTPMELCRRPRVFGLLVAVITLWFVQSLVFFCLSFNVGHWTGNPFLNNGLSGLVEFVACLLVVPVVERIGRRSTNVISLLIAGSLILLAEITAHIFGKTEAVGIAQVAIYLIAKFVISGSFNLLFLYSAELFPTSIRNTAVGVSSMGGRAGSIAAPFLIQIQHVVSWLLPVALGAVSLGTAFLASRLPETKDLKLPSTMDEAETVYKSRKQGKTTKALINSSRTDCITLGVNEDKLLNEEEKPKSSDGTSECLKTLTCL
ncbi:solute carrier family 22 member 4-like [Clavelina lepadiformis]|uniref:solute carrier family 22 member 4-like n=1 Tax=Clavelina lepadiformis TaxID=159417 RepID=UPI0040420A96